MANFFREGGFPMLPVLLFGLVLLYAAARYASDGRRARLRFIIALAVLLVVTTAHGMLMCVTQVFWYVQDPARVPDAQLGRTLMTGLMESSRPGALGGGLLGLALLLTAIGAWREQRRELTDTR